MKLIVLDRDGVINEDSDDHIKSPEEWIPIPGSLEAIACLTQAGYRVVVATNQPGIDRGFYDIENLNQIHEKMYRLVNEAGGTIEAIFFCPSVDDTDYYRKPNPGMLKDIGRRLKVRLEDILVVGDNLKDIQAAQAVGAKPILVCTGQGKRTLRENPNLQGVWVFDDLAAAVDFILN